MSRYRSIGWGALVALVVVGGPLGGCTGAPTVEVLEPEDRDQSLEGEGKFEAWNAANNPAYVDGKFAYYAHQLPLEGHGPVPVPGDYWATQRDNLNVRWDGDTSLSPAEKYAKAFNQADVPANITKYHGIESCTTCKVCTTETDCTDQKNGASCARPRGADKGRCVPGWWGICHGWAPYALSEPAAKNPVTRKAPDGSDVTFYPGDLEGLMSLVYTKVPTKFLSSRCNKDQPATDSMGRLVDGECRDMNPGSWHVLVTNMMGLRQQGFVIDQTYDDEVWNQPAYGYKITNAVDGKLPEITKADAIAKLGLDMTLTALLPTTPLKKDEQKAGEHAAAAAGDYFFKLSGTGDADLYVKKGAAPTTSEYDCRPYASSAVEECKVTLAAGEKVFWLVAGYAAESSVQLGVAVPGATGEYSYNTAAKKFFYAEMDFSFISESRPARTSHADDYQSYLHTKHYAYILETDADNKILGGEWVGDSRTSHPDFAWWPTGKATYSTMAGGLITYADVKKLNEEAAGIVPPPAEATVTVLENFKVQTSGAWASKYVTVVVEPGYDRILINMTGTGDADLYVRPDRNPTVYAYACKSTTAGSSTESCSTDVPLSGKTFFIRARTKTPNTTVTITATKIKSGATN